jgi:hypothetical protein
MFHLRNIIFPCYRHKTPATTACKESRIGEKVFAAYGKALMRWPVKVALIVATLAITAIGVWGNIALEQGSIS